MDDMIRRIGLMLMAGIALCAGPLPTAAAADATRYGYTAKYMGVPEGLSSQRAYKVCCDADGAMWIATLDGIDRWNGRTMKHYGLESAMKFSDASGRTTSLVFDARQRLHAYDNAGRIYRFDAMGDRFEPLVFLADYAGEGLTVNCLCIDSRSMLWVGMSDGVCCFDPQKKTLQWIERGAFVTDILELPQGLAVASTRGVRLFTCDGRELHHFCPADYVQSLCMTPDGKLLLAGTFSRGVRVIDLIACEVRQIPQLDGLPHTPVRTMVAQDASTLLVGFDGDGVYALDLRNWQAAPQFTKSNGLLNAMGVYSICLDHEQNVWVATYTGGVAMLEPEEYPVALYRHRAGDTAGLADSNVNSLAEVRRGELWVATDDGVSILDLGTGAWRQILTGCVCLDIACDSSRDLVAVATYGNGVYVYDTQRRQRAHYHTENTPLQSNYLPALEYDADGNLWVAQLDDRTMILDRGTGRWRALEVQKVRSLCECGDSTIVAGMVDGVAVVARESGTVRRLFDATALAGRDVNTFVQAVTPKEDGRVWLGTDGGGLCLLDLRDGSYRQLTTENRLPSNRVSGLATDRNGNLWIGTDHGLSCLAADSDSLIYDLNYRQILRRSFNRSAAALLSDGRIAMGSTSGLLIFYPHVSQGVHSPHELRLTDFRVDNLDEAESRKRRAGWNRMLREGRIELGHRHNSFSMMLESICYRYGDDLAYRYCLEGFDRTWSPLSRDVVVQYKNLQPGSYLFRVRSYSLNSGTTLDERSVEIVIGHPWWWSWWAWAIYGVLAVTAVCALWRYKHRKLQLRYMNDKMAFFVSIAHDIRTPLTLVKAPLDLLDADCSLGPETRQQVDLARLNLHRLLDMLSQLFEFERMEHMRQQPHCGPVSLNDAVGELVTAFVPLCQHEGIDLRVGEIPEGLCVEADVRLLNRILNNLLSNAVKYTPEGGWVSIRAEETRQTVCISVSDNGIGIPEKEQRRLFTSFFRARNAINSQAPGTGLGLSQAKRFALLLGGDITFRSEEGKGSTFMLTLRRSELPQLPVGNSAASDENPGEDPASSSRDTILVVDDNDELRRFLHDIFSPEYRVVLRSDAASALSYLETEYPSIIISDVMMIGMQGDEMCRLIKNNPVTAGIPVLLLTAKANNRAMVEGLEMGADDYIAKPFDVAVLKARVHTHIANRHRLHEYYGKIALQREGVPHDAGVQPNEADCDFVKRARQIVESHLADTEFDIEHLCREMAMCRTLFYERLKTLMGQTPQEFIRMIRLDHAEMLLSRGEPVIDVAIKTGFANVKYFSTVFKKHYGVPPSRYHAK